MGSSLMERSSFASSSSRLLLGYNFQQKQFLMSPFGAPFEKNRIHVMRLSRKDVNFNTVAAISEDLVKSSSSTSSSSSSLVSEKAVTFKVRAVVTVRNKIKEDFKETLVKHLDAFTDRIGRNVVLELVSTEIDPSKFFNDLKFCLFFYKEQNDISIS